MSTQHTPGPWTAEGWENLVVNCAEGYTLTLAAGRKGAGLEELKANARLIASAPRLLMDLEGLIESVSHLLPYNHPALVNARASIAKAKGERATGAGWTDADAKEFGDYRTDEELAAHYPRKTMWVQGEGAK